MNGVLAAASLLIQSPNYTEMGAAWFLLSYLWLMCHPDNELSLLAFKHINILINTNSRLPA